MYVAKNKTDKVLKIRTLKWAWMLIQPGETIESEEKLIGLDGVEIKIKEDKKKNGS